MSSEMITIPKEEYDALLEEVGILRDSDMMQAIHENETAKKAGVTPWEIQLPLSATPCGVDREG